MSLMVKIPDGFSSERKYLINTVFHEFLGIPVEIRTGSYQGYEIVLQNGNKLLVEDHFFSEFTDGLEYLKEKNLPEGVFCLRNQFTVEQDLPVFYGKPEISITDGENKSILCRADLFADIFLMLSRWEEYVIQKKDQAGRFAEEKSFLVMHGIQRRPVVNESAGMIWNMLLFLGYSGGPRQRSFEPVLTHDVDEIIRNKSYFRLLRIIAGDLVLRRKPAMIFDSIRTFFKYKMGLAPDPYDTFDFLMDESEGINTKSCFYFLSQKSGSANSSRQKYSDFRYDISGPEAVRIVKNIIARGHTIGVHGSFNAFDDSDILSEEINNLKELATEVTDCRMHYLKFTPSVTWRIEDKNKILCDSTLGFSGNIGFRCGTCFSFPVFDFLMRRQLSLIEMPLTVMDTALLELKRDPEESYLLITSLVDVVRKYNGKFVLLWHNSSLNSHEWKSFGDIYPRIINYLGQLSAYEN